MLIYDDNIANSNIVRFFLFKSIFIVETIKIIFLHIISGESRINKNNLERQNASDELP